MRILEKTVKNKKNTFAIAAGIVFCVIVLLFIIFQIYIKWNGNTIKTEIALADTAVKAVTVDMFVVRDEKIVSSNSANIVSAVSDGTRVNANETVAYSFADPSSAGNIIKMAEIKEQLNYYSDLISKSASVVSDTSSYDNRISRDIVSFAAAVSSGKFEDLKDKKDELRDAITSKQTATGVELDLSGAISALQAEYSALQGSTSVYTEIKSGGSGYYISGTDGYENTLAYTAVDDWSIADVENALTAEPVIFSGNIGRIVHGYYWYLACVTDTESINTLREGNRKTISFPDSSIGDFSAEVYSIRTDRSTGKSLVIFRCLLMNEDFATLRKERARIHIETYEGYRVDTKAIRVNEDNETGVYVIKGGVMTFKKAKIEYSGDDYCIVSNPYKDDVTRKNEYINLYDEYITEGKDLREGKLIK